MDLTKWPYRCFLADKLCNCYYYYYYYYYHYYYYYFMWQVKTEPAKTAMTSTTKTGVPTTVSQATVIPASMLTVSALPSMDETMASTQQPLITPMKRKHEDEDDDYDS